MIAVFFEIGFGGDKRLQRLCNTFVDQWRLAIQALHGHVWQVAGNGFAQNSVGAIFIRLICRAELHFDVRMRLFERGHHRLIGDVKEVAIGIGELDCHLVLGVRGGGGQGHNHCSQCIFHYIYSSWWG